MDFFIFKLSGDQEAYWIWFYFFCQIWGIFSHFLILLSLILLLVFLGVQWQEHLTFCSCPTGLWSLLTPPLATARWSRKPGLPMKPRWDYGWSIQGKQDRCPQSAPLFCQAILSQCFHPGEQAFSLWFHSAVDVPDYRFFLSVHVGYIVSSVKSWDL